MGCLRIACLFVPEFPLAVFLRGKPNGACRPVALLGSQSPESNILAVTPPARRGGVRPGLSPTQARALLPGLIVRRRDPGEELAAQEALLKVADTFSPIVEEAGPGIVYLDFTGTRNERGLAGEMIERMAAAGLTARVGIAGSRLTAKVAAERSRNEPAVIPPGREARYLSPLPIALLEPPMKLAETFSRWGIESIGALALLPTAEIASRLGQEGVRLQKSALGVEHRPLIGRRPPLHFSEGIDLEWSLTELEPFLFLARQALERLVSRLAGYGLVCRRLLLTLRLEPSGEEAHTLDLPAPTADMKSLLALLRGKIESRSPRAPVSGFILAVVPEPPRQIQSSLFGPSLHSPDLLTTIARLSTLLGPDRVGSPERVAGHRPERFAIRGYDPPPPPKFSPLLERGSVGLALRILRPGVTLEVKRGNLFPSEPVFMKSIRKRAFHPDISGKVRVASGPWRLEEGWWSEKPVSRDYWDVELFDGGLYRIFYDLQCDRWFADGIYG